MDTGRTVVYKHDDNGDLLMGITISFPGGDIINDREKVDRCHRCCYYCRIGVFDVFIDVVITAFHTLLMAKICLTGVVFGLQLGLMWLL